MQERRPSSWERPPDDYDDDGGDDDAGDDFDDDDDVDDYDYQVLGGGDLAHPLELHPAQLHAEGGHPVDVHLLLVRAAQDVERLVHRLHLLLVVDRLNGDFAKAAERVVIDLKYVVISHFFRAQVFDNTHIVSEEARLVKVHNMSDQEVEDMVTSLTGIS